MTSVATTRPGRGQLGVLLAAKAVSDVGYDTYAAGESYLRTALAPRSAHGSSRW